MGSSDPNSAAETQEPDELPGGVVNEEVFSEGTWFDDEGRLYTPESTNQDDETQAAFCSFLFGEPADVARTAQLGESMGLFEGSGLNNLGGNGVGYACGYAETEDSTEPDLVLSIWSQERDVQEDITTALFTADLPGSWSGYLIYGPEYDGAVMDESVAQQWLTEAGARLNGVED